MRAGSDMPTYIRSTVMANASNTPKTMLLMSARSTPAKMLIRNNSRSGNAVEMDQKAYPIYRLPLRNTFSMIEALVMLQAMTTKIVLGFFQVISSDVACEEYA